VSAMWFDGGGTVPITKPGTPAHRHQARLGAATLVTRNNGTADDLRLILTQLDLWPRQDTPDTS
jgi:hypothetical protein